MAAFITKVEDRKVISRELLICDSASGEVQSTIELKRYRPRTALCFNPAGDKIIGIARNAIVTWSLADKAVESAIDLPPNSNYRRSIALSADGNTLALTRFMGDAIEFWDLSTGKAKGMLTYKFPKTVSRPSFQSDLSRFACSQQHPVILDTQSLVPFEAPK